MYLRSAWSVCCPLPSNWEIRITDNPTILPYWVDHRNKLTQMHPPTLEIECHDLTGDDHETKSSCLESNADTPSPLELMPEYAHYSGKLTDSLERLFSLNLQRVRVRSAQHTVGYSRHSVRQAIENSVIEEAHVVFTTLNSSGHSSLETSTFTTTVVDEVNINRSKLSTLSITLNC